MCSSDLIDTTHITKTPLIPVITHKTITDDDKTFHTYNNDTYLHRLCCKLNMEERDYLICKQISAITENNKILEKHNPLSRITTIIYYVSMKLNLPFTKSEIADICSVSDVTINKCYIKMNKRNELFDSIFAKIN